MATIADSDEPRLSYGDERRTRHFYRRVETLTSRIRRKEFLAHGLEEFLSLQEHVLQLQIDVQNEIAKAKQRRPRTRENHEYVEILRRIRRLSRDVGDAVAWTALLNDRQVIHSLSKNDLVPIPTKMTDSHRGTIAFARANTSAEWGLPIIHDISNVLRIGDVTFMRPTGRRDVLAEYRTFELKVTRVAEGPIDEQGTQSVELRVTAISSEPFPEFPHEFREKSSDASTKSGTAQPANRKIDRRIERQLERMDRARDSKNAMPNKVSRIGGERVFTARIDDEPQPEWRNLRQSIRQAKQDGYAYFSLGGFVGYAIFYNANGLTKQDVQNPRIADDLAATLMQAGVPSRNSITVSSVPAADDNSKARLAMPFLLWEVPQKALHDMIRGRLAIMALYNGARMEDLLTEAGLTVNPESSASDPRQFEVVVPLKWSNAHGEYHLGGPWEDITIATQEFRHPSAVVKRVQAIAKFADHVKVEDLGGESRR